MKKKTDLLKWKQDLDDEFKELVNRMKEAKSIECDKVKKKCKIPPKFNLIWMSSVGTVHFILLLITGYLLCYSVYIMSDLPTEEVTNQVVLLGLLTFFVLVSAFGLFFWQVTLCTKLLKEEYKKIK